MMRDPCPYCGMQRVALYRVDRSANEIVRDIRDHDCPAWERQPELSTEPTDTSFIAAARNDPERFKAWQRYVNRQRGK